MESSSYSSEGGAAFKERWIQMTANRWGKTNTRSPRRKGKSKREKLLNSNSGKEEKKTKRAEEQTKQEQTLSSLAG
jgi:hypothetical protein